MNIKANFFLSVFLLNILCLCSDAYAQVKKRPNIILIMADDIGYETTNINGGVDYQTPQLDNMAKNGIRFTNCFSQPLCTPSRVKIMTGRYNSDNYVDFEYLPYEETTFGNILKNAGYKTMIAGKWQLNGQQIGAETANDITTPSHFGFDEYCLWQLVGKGSRYAKPEITQNGQKLKTTIDDYGPDIFSSYILNFIDKNKDEPFFVYYPMVLTHSPFTPTPKSKAWADHKMRLKEGKNKKEAFQDMVSYTDDIVGRIRQKLKDLKIDDNTIVIWTGDNGTAKSITSSFEGENYKGGKGSLKNNGTHVSLICEFPNGGMKNVVSDNLIEFSDFVPTLCDFAMQPIPQNVVGKSFAGFLSKDYKATPRENIFVHYYARINQVESSYGTFTRNKNYKYYWDGRFYDMVKDKWENKPLNLKKLNTQELINYNELKAALDSKKIWDFSKVEALNKTDGKKSSNSSKKKKDE
ncbi:sulfatase-like hydrolase/transferase [Polaribacter sp. BAL334]|uniref:sulfatase-like hydrolase/transferase n=1 Tax=Polaribacter sp. BAL334 TaxID=1708178 RepID=UPI0018D27160|nr:sulfatase-like hydrolase/transferase [Polaribacter sp. BAL334]MBG7613115.1 sulfatase-like hydrolase/transferase [Polaribacter sp. BAL334]